MSEMEQQHQSQVLQVGDTNTHTHMKFRAMRLILNLSDKIRQT